MSIRRSANNEESFFQAYFYCPKCGDQRPYNVRSASVGFTFYYISLFEMEKLDKFVVCQVCKNGFNPKILKPGNQSLLKLVCAAKHELMNSRSPGSLKLKLMSDGLNEEFVDKLILLAQS